RLPWCCTRCVSPEAAMHGDENLDIGSDTGTPVDDKDYQVPFAFTGKINKITLTIGSAQAHPGRREEAAGGAERQEGGRVTIHVVVHYAGRCASGGPQLYGRGNAMSQNCHTTNVAGEGTGQSRVEG